MPGFVIPHTLYHGGVYAFPELKAWFEREYAKRVGRKPDMGKSCIRFTNPETIPWDLLTEPAGKISVHQWIEHYEKTVKR